MGVLEGKKAWRERGWAGDDIPTTSNEIKALPSCGEFSLSFPLLSVFLLSGTRSKSNIYLSRKCILVLVAFIIESSLPENIKARPFFYRQFNRLLCCSLLVLKISSA